MLILMIVQMNVKVVINFVEMSAKTILWHASVVAMVCVQIQPHPPPQKRQQLNRQQQSRQRNQLQRNQLQRNQLQLNQQQQRPQKQQQHSQLQQNHHVLRVVMKSFPVALRIVREIQYALKLVKISIFNASRVIAMVIAKPPPQPLLQQLQRRRRQQLQQQFQQPL